MMVVDVQCVMPGIQDMAKCFHTELLTTSPKAKMPGVNHLEFEESKAHALAHEIVRRAVDAYTRRRPERVNIPDEVMDLVAGFTVENICTNRSANVKLINLKPAW